MPGLEHDWVRIECRASIARLRYGQTAIVDRNDPTVRGHIRAGNFVVVGEHLEPVEETK